LSVIKTSKQDQLQNKTNLRTDNVSLEVNCDEKWQDRSLGMKECKSPNWAGKGCMKLF